MERRYQLLVAFALPLQIILLLAQIALGIAEWSDKAFIFANSITTAITAWEFWNVVWRR